MIHRRACTLIYTGCSESLRGVDPSMIHRRGCTPIGRDGAESFEGCTPFYDSPQADYTHLQGLR